MKPTPKFVCVHPRFAGFTSHHFNECSGYKEELRRRGNKLVLLVNHSAPAEISAVLNARAVLDDPTFRMEWSFEERSRRFLEMLHAQVTPLVLADDRVMITVSTQLEAHAFTCWLKQLPAGKKPWVLVLFLSDRWNRAGREEYERQAGEFRQLRSELAGLLPEDGKRLILASATELLSAELSDLLGANVAVAPLPVPYDEPADIEPRLGARPRIGLLGGTRREKGAHLIPETIRACRALVDVEFVVHLANDNLPVEDSRRLAAIAQEPGVTVIDRPMQKQEYHAALKSADILLFPYEIIPYRKRTSGVFSEAVAFGKPVIATRGTWLGEQIESGHAAGTLIPELHPVYIAQAISSAVSDLEALQQSARAKASAWRENSGVPAFLDFVEQQIATRF